MSPPLRSKIGKDEKLILDEETGLLRFENRSSWKGASRYRDALAGWRVSQGDADADLLSDLSELRERSRDLGRSNPVVAAANSVRATNVVGRGLRFHAAIDREFLGLSADQAEQWERAHEQDFGTWAESVECDLERSLDFYDYQDLVSRATHENGDHFVLLTNSSVAAWPYRLALQNIEADRVCNKDRARDTDTLIAGVRKDTNGAPIAYQIRSRHPGSDRRGDVSWIERPAWTSTGQPAVLHLRHRLRTGETRGVPSLSPVIEPLKQIDRYSDAEIEASVKDAFFTLIVKSQTGDGLAGLEMNQWKRDRQDYYADARRKMEGGGSHILGLFPDDDVQGFDPGRPNAQYDVFVQSVLSLISASLEIPYEILMRRFDRSYSAARAAIIQFGAYILKERGWLIRKFCNPIREQQLYESVAMGRIAAPGFLNDYRIRRAYLGGEWIGDAPAQINETAAIQAARERVELGISTKQRETAALTGEDWERVQRQRERERRTEGAETNESAESGRMSLQNELDIDSGFE